MDRQQHQMPLNNEKFKKKTISISFSSHPLPLFFFSCLILVVWSDNKANSFLVSSTDFFLNVYIRKEKNSEKPKSVNVCRINIQTFLSFIVVLLVDVVGYFSFFSFFSISSIFLFFSIWPENNINETINSYGNMFCFQYYCNIFHFSYRLIFFSFPSMDYIM